MPNLQELLHSARLADEPHLLPPVSVDFGGIDPLGLREINFDLMNELFRGLNNVAGHIRPYILTTWSWGQALKIADQSGQGALEGKALTEALDAMEDFVDRIEVIYLWTQILRNPNVDLPGRGSLGTIMAADSYVFGGGAWVALRGQRRYSTSFRAAVNYGPGLKNLGWARSPDGFGEILVPTDVSRPAIDAFDALLADRMNHPAFNSFGSATVTRDEAEAWGEAWSLDSVTEAEAQTAASLLAGSASDPQRSRGFKLLIDGALRKPSGEALDTPGMRTRMATIHLGDESELAGTRDLWRRLQTRQAFRLALESLYGWITRRLGSRPRSTSYLVQEFLAVEGTEDQQTTRSWLHVVGEETDNPVRIMELLIGASVGDDGAPSLESAIRRTLAFCLSGDLDDRSTSRPDRLPIARAKREASVLLDQPPADFMRHVIEAWVLAQHTYWSIGRGLADARAGGKQILRLRIVMEEGGWALSDGRAQITRIFQPTGDRLATALSLAKECGLVTT